MSQTPADVDSKAHVLVVDLSEPTLCDEHHHHLGRVLRLRAGDLITATDGRGSWRIATLGTGWPTRSDIEWNGEIVMVAQRSKPVAVGFALTKGDKPEAVVQKLTELGVDRIVPFTAEHSVARWEPEKAARNVARLRTIATEALQQSRQAWLPRIDELTTFTSLASESPSLAFGSPVRADRGGDALLVSEARFVLVGPEGGWSLSERTLLPSTVGIASTVLRAETASVVTGAFLVAKEP